MKRFIYLCTVLCTLLLSVTPVKAQKTQKNSTVTVEGIVVDENNVPMPGITVNVQEKQTDAVTDEDGKFYLRLPSGNQTSRQSTGLYAENGKIPDV